MYVPTKRARLNWLARWWKAPRPRGCRVTFDIVPYQDMVRLTVTHDELEPGSGMDTGIRQGWPIVLSSLKSLLETGKGLDVFAKPS
ncbi:hypothetical protein G6F65_021129 [Rhizopus arrhizus]|nr:hypothetical protein G6F65_021129 [Rhizopus arrhizus]